MGIKSVNSMINVILKAVDKCDGLHTVNKECGLQAGKLTEHMAALSAATGQVYQKCPSAAVPNGKMMGPIAAPVMCTVDLKNTAKGLFKAVKGSRRTTTSAMVTTIRGNAPAIS